MDEESEGGSVSSQFEKKRGIRVVCLSIVGVFAKRRRRPDVHGQ
jgi:hypothetical protein